MTKLHIASKVERLGFRKPARHFLILAFFLAVWSAHAQRLFTAEDYFRRGYERHLKGDLDGAISDYTKAIKINSRDAHYYDNRGEARRVKGDLDGAIADSTQAIGIDPNLVDAYVTRGLARRSKHDFDGAIADYTRSITIDSHYVDGYNALAWLLATASQDSVRNGKKALACAGKAAELSKWEDANVLDTLAAAYAEIGDFETAIKWENKALSLAQFANKNEEGKVRQRLQLYLERKRYRQP